MLQFVILVLRYTAGMNCTGKQNGGYFTKLWKHILCEQFNFIHRIELHWNEKSYDTDNGIF